MELDLKGTYVVALQLYGAQEIVVGRLGEIRFPAGWYLYAGSALGPGGLGARLGRHLRRLGEGIAIPAIEKRHGTAAADRQAERGKRAHWHVDYLREASAWAGAWAAATEDHQECDWAAALLDLPGADQVALGFGASDCRCASHLVWVPERPADRWFAHVLGAERV